VTDTPRAKMLAEASRIVVGDREDTYGGPEDSFRAIGELWTTYLHNSQKLPLSTQLDPEDVAIMMTLLKIARLATGGFKQPDTWIDAAGYTACGYEIALGE
jgi:hypothetical protein